MYFVIRQGRGAGRGESLHEEAVCNLQDSLLASVGLRELAAVHLRRLWTSTWLIISRRQLGGTRPVVETCRRGRVKSSIFHGVSSAPAAAAVTLFSKSVVAKCRSACELLSVH